MRTTIQFHTKPQLWTIEIKYIWPNALLSTKLVATNATILQCLPKHYLRVCHPMPQTFALVLLV